MGRTPRTLALALAVGLAVGGCYGPFNLTRRLHHWNGQLGDRWISEAVFIVFIWAPVYGLATLGDAVIFNSIEFWGGENPVSPPEIAAHPNVETQRIARGDAEAVLSRISGPAGSQLLIEQFQNGQPAGSLRIERQGNLTVGKDAEGRTLLTVQSLPDGSLLVHDAQANQTKWYSAAEVEQALTSARQ